MGAPVGHGLPEADARGYEESVRQGSVLLSVHAASARQAQEARGIFERVGDSDARAYRAPAR